MSDDVQRDVLMQKAFERHVVAMKALPADEVIGIRIDIQRVTQVIEEVIPRLPPFREALLEMPEPSASMLDDLESLNLALLVTHKAYLTARAKPAVDVSQIVALAEPLRERLLSNVQSLAAYGLIPPFPVRHSRKKPHVKLASDLVGLVSVFRDNWSQVTGKTPVTEVELVEAARLAEEILTELGNSEHRAAEADAEALELRARAFTLLLHAYQGIRRGLTFLRWHERDYDQIAPPLYPKHGGNRANGSGPKAS